MDVLNEAVNVCQALFELEYCKNKTENDSGQWYATISEAYMSLGRIEAIYNKIGFSHSDKKKIVNLHSVIVEELKNVINCKEKEGAKSVTQSLRNVNKAIVDYLK